MHACSYYSHTMKTRAFVKSLIAAILATAGLLPNACAQANDRIRLVIGIPVGSTLDQQAHWLTA
jgi:spermidine/putrescine-binding protein